MGVSGCGKTSVGEALGRLLDIEFIDGDNLHSARNIAKMSRGEALNDSDRAPWLAVVGRTLEQAEGPLVIGCSALKRKYRDWIRSEVSLPTQFIHLKAPKAILAARVQNRSGHFMPSSLLDSQYDTLEDLCDDELGTEIDISAPFEIVVSATRAFIEGDHT